MAKSLRSKSKRAFRSKKREAGKYAAADAARLARLHAKLATVKDTAVVARPDDEDEDEDEGIQEKMDVMDGEADPHQGAVPSTVQDGVGTSLDVPGRPTSMSTHGPRGSRREEWRKSKGMDPIPKRRGMNRQGGVAARRKAGRPSRRR